jgi:hypothetical protein
MKRHEKNTPQPPTSEPDLDQTTVSDPDHRPDEFDQGVVLLDMEGFFDLDPEAQEARVRQMLEMLSPNPEVRARARRRAEGEETQ